VNYNNQGLHGSASPVSTIVYHSEVTAFKKFKMAAAAMLNLIGSRYIRKLRCRMMSYFL